jgi:hypothetical protein
MLSGAAVAESCVRLGQKVYLNDPDTSALGFPPHLRGVLANLYIGTVAGVYYRNARMNVRPVSSRHPGKSRLHWCYRLRDITEISQLISQAVRTAIRGYCKQHRAFGTGGMGIRTPGLVIANDALYQLSYTPKFFAERP